MSIFFNKLRDQQVEHFYGVLRDQFDINCIIYSNAFSDLFFYYIHPYSNTFP